jgi:sigma-E factor negative regulatory protein RseB
LSKTLLSKATNIAILAMLVASFLPLQVFAQEEQATDSYPSGNAQVWLAKMSDAGKSLNYTISFILLKPGLDSQPYLWRHGVNEDGIEMEQLNLLNGPGREVVRIGNKVSYFEPNVPPYSLQSSIINGPFPSEFLQRPEKLMLGYEAILVGRSRIAGDREGKLLEQIQVTGLQVTKEPDSFFGKVETGMLPEVVSFNTDAPFNSLWEIGYIPKGMLIVKRDLRPLSGSAEVVEYIMLSDGLVDVSVYLQQRDNNQPQNNLVGTVQSDTLLTIEHGDLNITIIGKLPATTANAIAKSIQRIK